MRNYKDLSPKEKFIRTCICVPIFLVLLAAVPFILSSYVTFTTGSFIRYAISFVIVIIVSIGQLIMTYKAWKNDEQ